MLVENPTREQFRDTWTTTSSHILQSWEWGDVKGSVQRIIINETPITIFLKRLPFSGKSFGYIPRPFNKRIQNLNEILSQLIRYSKEKLNLSHIVIDPNLTLDNQENFSEFNFKAVGKTIQPNQTDMVTLEKKEEDLWMGLSGKYRRNIKKSQREGVTVEIFESGSDAVNRFYKVMEEVFLRTSYVMYGIDYFQKVWHTLSESKLAKIFIAKRDGIDLGSYLVVYDEVGSYELYGGVTDAGRNFEAGYLLKWESIKHSNSIHKKFYDHWGVAKLIGEEYDKNDELYQISRFKKGFGGQYTEFLPQQVLIFDNSGYLIYQLGKRINSITLQIKKRLK